MKKVAVLQSSYIPWKGYFDIINDVNLFIFYDDVQYTKNDWRNRNKIKTINGTNWLTIPTGSNLQQLICEVPIEKTWWAKKHWKTIEQFYHRTPYFDEYKEFFKYVFLECKWENLSELNQFLIKTIANKFLQINTEFKDSREFNLTGKKQDRLLDLLIKVGAELYISGPAAKNYIDEERFREAGIKLVYKNYLGYPEYSQLYPPFVHEVSIIDLLFNCGPDSPYYIWGWRENAGE